MSLSCWTGGFFCTLTVLFFWRCLFGIVVLWRCLFPISFLLAPKASLVGMSCCARRCCVYPVFSCCPTMLYVEQESHVFFWQYCSLTLSFCAFSSAFSKASLVGMSFYARLIFVCLRPRCIQQVYLSFASCWNCLGNSSLISFARIDIYLTKLAKIFLLTRLEPPRARV